jgi:hypothetical protein
MIHHRTNWTWLIAAGFICFASRGLAAEDGFAFGFAGYPERVEGAPEEVKTIDIFTTLTAPTGSAFYWIQSFSIEGGELQAFTLDDVEDFWAHSKGNCWSGASFTTVSETDPSRHGAGRGTVACSPDTFLEIEPGTPVQVGHFKISAVIPDKDCASLKLTYEDGLTRVGFGTVENSLDGYAPDLTSCIILLCPAGEGGRMIPGDTNGDGGLDLSDAVALLVFLFLGSSKELPCGDGTPQAPGNMSLLDWQPDGTIDISDAVATLSFLFVGSQPHALAVPGAEATGCVPIAGCESRCGN